MSWALSIWLYKTVRFLPSRSLSRLLVVCITFRFNVYSIMELCLSFSASVGRFSELGGDSVFNYLSPTYNGMI